MDIDMLITAIEQGPDTTFIAKEGPGTDELQLTRWNIIFKKNPLKQAARPALADFFV